MQVDDHWDLEANNEQNALDEDVRMKYHLHFATTSRIFITTCMLQVVWAPFNKLGIVSRMKGNARGETDDQKESRDLCSFDWGPHWHLWMAIAEASPG